MQPYSDPMWGELDAVERSIERTFEPGLGFYPDPDAFMDDLGQALGELEATIEGTIVQPPPLEEPEPPLLSPPPAEPPLQGALSHGPPALAEPLERSWRELISPPAARPFLSSDGLSPFSHRPRGHAGTGMSGSGRSALTRWCPEANTLVTEETCIECENWGDHGAGFEECLFDWQERNRNEPEETEREEEEY